MSKDFTRKRRAGGYRQTPGENDGGDMIDRDEFLCLSDEEVRRIVTREKKPRTGIFLADGNRRLVMTQTGLTPGADPGAFYGEYLKIVTRYFRENLGVFFGHGLKTLFFPLFGDSILERENAYRQSVIPGLAEVLFQGETWLQFYREYDIRVRVYGRPEMLEREFPGLDLPGKIQRGAAITSRCRAHTLYFGFFSTPWPAVEMISPVHDFMASNGREPNRGELIELYYREPVPPADFFINSTRIAGLGALPPLISGKETRVYTLVPPGVFALNRETFREILYDLLFCRGENGETGTGETRSSEELEALKAFYTLHRKTLLGCGKRIGGFRVPDV